jgi:hypothetical protein
MKGGTRIATASRLPMKTLFAPIAASLALAFAACATNADDSASTTSVRTNAPSAAPSSSPPTSTAARVTGERELETLHESSNGAVGTSGSDIESTEGEGLAQPPYAAPSAYSDVGILYPLPSLPLNLWAPRPTPPITHTPETPPFFETSFGPAPASSGFFETSFGPLPDSYAGFSESSFGPDAGF